MTVDTWTRRVREGAKVEQEHRDLISFLNSRIAKGRNISEDEIYERIAIAHLMEDPDYYRKLKQAGL